MSDKRINLLFWTGLIAITLLAMLLVPFSKPLPGDYDQAVRLLHHLPYTTGRFLPVGYTSILYYSMLLFGLNGIFILQAAFYISLVVLIRKLLLVFNFKLFNASVLALLIGLYPYALLNIKRTNDAAIYVVLFLLLFYAILRIKQINFLKAILYGVAFGLLITIRPNVFSLLLLFFLFFFVTYYKVIFSKLKILCALLLALLISCFVFTAPTNQTFLIFSNNGMYNLYEGNNPLAEHYLLTQLNGEPDIVPALKAAGYENANIGNIVNPVWTPIYKKLAVNYILTHPFQYMKLIFIKLYIFLSPNYQHAAYIHSYFKRMLDYIVHVVIIFPVFLWVIFLFLTGEYRTLYRYPFTVLFVLLYTLPFLLISSAPRYRIPVDILVTIDACRLLKIYFCKKGKLKNGSN